MEKDPQPEECIVQIPDNRDSINLSTWVSDVDHELIEFRELARSRELEQRRNLSIYLIPDSLKKLNRKAYEPQKVSIGPYHHGEWQLESMEKEKKRVFFSFLDKTEKGLECYVRALTPMVEDLKNAYHNLDPKWKHDSQAFLKLMIVDGCFLLEIMRSTFADKPIGYTFNDPIFDNYRQLFLQTDMLMLENQLPLRLLVVLVATEGGVPISDGFKQLGRLIREFFCLPHGNTREYENCLHILDFYRRSMLLQRSFRTRRYSTKPESRCSDGMPGPRKTDPYISTPATDLKELGVRFRRLEMCSLKDISFQGRTLRLPQIIVDDASESKYLNMMAFERFDMEASLARYEVTSFVLFMDSIINSTTDVRLLQLCGIVRNMIGSDEAVANLFSSLARDVDVAVDLESNNIAMVQGQVVNYCRKPVPRFKVYSKHMLHYFNNLVGLSIIGAFSIFALAAIQTLYTVLGYYHSKK